MKITCRICKIQQGEFFTLDSVVPFCGQEVKLLDVFNKCFHLNAAFKDSLPQVVCSSCLEKLKDFYEFLIKAAKSDLEFRKEVLQETECMKNKSENLDDFATSQDYQNTVAPLGESNGEEEVITTEDDFEEDDEHYEEQHEQNSEIAKQSNHEDDEDVEDTDILFELYSKNDSCLEKYLNYNKVNEDSQETLDNSLSENQIQKKIEHTVEPIVETEIESREILLNDASVNIDSSLESDTIPTIEITRIKLPLEPSENVQTLMLEPLVEIRKWQCADCGRKYLTTEKLKQHQKLHSKSEDCQCEICGCDLKSLYEYREHMKAHGTERKFSCEFCDKTFTTRANLKAHLYIHTNLRPFKCEICSKTFQQKSILKTHMTLHTGKPFECTLCHRRFSRTAHLNIHMRQHNNIRPYQCTQCPSSYMQKSHLDRHISSSHLGVRFQCTICGKMYTKKPSLNTHMRDAHCATVSLYNCEICDLDFAKQKGLYYHLKSKHPDYKKLQS